MSSVWMHGSASVATTASLFGGRIETDVAVIGGGITGVTTAMLLNDAGLRVALIEAALLGAANTGRSTGNLYGTVSGGLAALRDKWNSETVREVFSLRMQAVDLVESTVARFGIDCGFRRVPLFAAVAGDDVQQLDRLQQEFDALVEAGASPQWLDGLLEQPVRVHRALRIDGQAQFNPYLYARGLGAALASRGVQVFERTPVVDIDAGEGLVRVATGEVHARFIVIATHSPIGFNLVQAEMEPYREYGISARLRGGDFPDGIFWIRDAGRSIRNYRHGSEDFFVVVGEKHKTGEPEEGVDYLQRLRDYARGSLGAGDFVHGWSAQQLRPADGLPYIGASAHGNVFIATGFAADGLTWGTVAATINNELVQGRESRASELLTPRRFTAVKSAKAWAAENIAVVKHLVADRLTDADVKAFGEVRPGEGRMMEIEGRKFAVYRAPDDSLTVLSPVCPHLKCHVSWNPEARSWDCPCHGSRFHADGEVMEGPAMESLERFPLLDET